MKLSEALERIQVLERGLEHSKQANKRIKQETRYIDYNRLLDRFNRQKQQLQEYEEVLRDIVEMEYTKDYYTSELMRFRAREVLNRHVSV